MIRVVNKRTHTPTDHDFPVHRGTPLGNPWTHIKGKTLALHQCASREESIAQYEDWLVKQIEDKNKEVCDALNQIYRMAQAGDVNLVCYCIPLNCHGTIIKRLIESKLAQ